MDWQGKTGCAGNQTISTQLLMDSADKKSTKETAMTRTKIRNLRHLCNHATEPGDQLPHSGTGGVTL